MNWMGDLYVFFFMSFLKVFFIVGIDEEYIKLKIDFFDFFNEE